MSQTLKSRTARASLFLLRENLKDLRSYAAEFDPDQIDRLVKTAELTSTTIKKLLSWIADAPTTERNPAPESETIDIVAVTRALAAAENGRFCYYCGGIVSPC
mgnify:CR=1 FL=1